MIDASDDIKIKNEIKSFIELIQTDFEEISFADLHIISVSLDFIDSCTFFKDPLSNEVNGNILINLDILNKRKKYIDRMCKNDANMNSSQILICLYTHILNHEYYHYKMQNMLACDLNNACRTLNEYEIQIVTTEERNAELYAIEKTLGQFDASILLKSLHVEKMTRELENEGHKGEFVDYHISDEEIESIIREKSKDL
jgi:hypothetical protein